MKFLSFHSVITKYLLLILLVILCSFTIHAQEPPDPSNVRMNPNDDKGIYDNDGKTNISNPTFQWGTSSGADGYQWAVTGNNGRPWIPEEIMQGGGNDDFTTYLYFKISSLSDGEYKFWVQSHVNFSYWSGWDPHCEFTIDTQSPTPPNSLNNPSNTTTDDTPNVYWSGEYDNSGASSNFIYFTSNQSSQSKGDWDKIWLESTLTSFDGSDNYISGTIIKYCQILYANELIGII